MGNQNFKGIFFFSFFAFVLLASPYFVFSQTVDQKTSVVDLQTQIQNLLKQIQALQQQVTALQQELGKKPETTSSAGETPAPSGATIQEPEVIVPELTRSLSRGASGDDVRKLQEFLAQDKEIYPDGLITGYFGPLTEAAVKKWQEKHGIESVGIIGPKTIAKFQELGRGRIQQLIAQGAGRPFGESRSERAGASGVIPPGLLLAPGIQKKIETISTTTATTTPVAPITTPSGIISATPATPAVPSSGTGTVAVPATPATPAVPATPAQPAATITTATTYGGCWASGEYPGVEPNFYLPDVGAGYAKLAKPGVNTIDGLKSACSQTDYDNLFQSYCSFRNSTTTLISPRVQQMVTLFDSNGFYLSGTCGVFGCDRQDCPIIAISTNDTIPPSIPTSLITIAISPTQINLSWAASTDNVGVTGYRIYRGSVQIATVTVGTVYSDTGLTAATAYSYNVAAYDVAGNISAQSASTSATTLSAGPPAPTNVQAVTNSSAQEQPPIVRYIMVFDYTLQSTTQSFNIYRKRPIDASFVKYTYNAQTSVNPSILPIPGSDESNLYHRSTNQWEWWTTLPAPAPNSAVGEYKFYVTAVDTNGVESVPSETKSFKLYAAPVITSPAEGSTISAPFTITVSGDPNAPSLTYGMVIYKQTTGGTAWSSWPAPSTNFTYSGPALNPSDNPHRLVVWFTSVFDRSFFATSIFNVSATTSSLDLRAKNLAAISQVLNEIKEKLLKLLRGL